ncbi:MAG: hypothetical protein IJF39_05065 [Clostridia bacterium]|nr:hypothetical protein [Clostridia bacterium]
MKLASLLINFSTFGLVEWCVVGVLAVVALIAFIAGCKKGFSNLKLSPVSWAFGCAIFLLLETFLHDQCFINALLPIEDPALASFVASMTWLVIALVARWLVFGLISVCIRCSKSRKIKQAEEIARREKETGEEILPDENEVYRPLPINGKIKPGPLNRMFGGIFAAANTLLVVFTALALVLVVLSMTPVYAQLGVVYTGSFADVWEFMHVYALDVLMIAIACAIIVKGYNDGLLIGLRNVGVWLLKVVAVVGGIYLPFSPWAADGGAFGFLSVGAQNLAALIPLPEMIPPVVIEVVCKVLFGIVIAVVLFFLVVLLGWLCGKLLKVVDESPVLWRIDGFIGAIVYIAIAALAVGGIIAVLYTLEFYGVFTASGLFQENSPLLSGAFGVCDSLLKPLLETVQAFFTQAAPVVPVEPVV